MSMLNILKMVCESINEVYGNTNKWQNEIKKTIEDIEQKKENPN